MPWGPRWCGRGLLCKGEDPGCVGFEIEHGESGGWAVDRDLQRLRFELQAAAGVMHLYFQVLLGELSCSGGEEDRGGRGCMQFFEHSLVLCRGCVGAGLRGQAHGAECQARHRQVLDSTQ